MCCLVFAVIYAQFSHGVHSLFMTWMFAIPLAFGATAAAGLAAAGAGDGRLDSRRLWALSAATFTVASCLRGIFEIAGTGSPWLYVYVAAGIVLALGAVVVFRR